MAEAYIYDAVRTPRGKGRKDGRLHEITPIQLATQVLQAVRDRNEIDTADVDDVVLGCVSPVAEQGADIARTAVLNADYAETTAGVQINRFCASGLEAVNMAAAKVISGEAEFAEPFAIDISGRVLLPEIGEVGVRVAEPRGLAQAHTVDDRRVVEGVADDRVLRAEEGLEQPGVGIETARVQDGVLAPDEGGDPPLELAVLSLRATDEAHRGHAEPLLVDTALCRRHDIRVVGEAQVVVGAQVQHAATVPEGHLRLLLADDLALVFGETVGLDRRELRTDVIHETLRRSPHPGATIDLESRRGFCMPSTLAGAATTQSSMAGGQSVASAAPRGPSTPWRASPYRPSSSSSTVRDHFSAPS